MKINWFNVFVWTLALVFSAIFWIIVVQYWVVAIPILVLTFVVVKKGDKNE